MNTPNQAKGLPETPHPPIQLLPAPPAAAPAPPGPVIPPASLPAPRKISRNGKIARLPKLERDMVNQLIFNNIPQDKIVGALEEHGIHVTRRNVSNWKTHGGYQEWRREQEHALQVRNSQDHLLDFLRKYDAGQLGEVGLQMASSMLSRFFLAPDATQQLATNPEAFSRLVATLCRVTQQTQALQKSRDDSLKAIGLNPERKRRELEKSLEITRSVYSSPQIG